MSERNVKRNKKNGNDAIIQIKNNQKKALVQLKKFIENSTPISGYSEKEKKKRNRVEYRNAQVFLLPNSIINENTLFEYTSCCVKVRRKTEIFNTKIKEWKVREDESFYLSTVTYNAETMARTIRNHWNIENSCNYVKDTALKEDYSRIRINPGIMSRLRSFALNILRFNKVNNIKRSIFKNSLDFNQVRKLKGVF